MMMAIVPVRSFSQGKTRLSDALSAAERRALIISMFQTVISAAQNAERVDQVLVISKDPLVIEKAEHLGVLSLQESDDDDLNSSLTKALDFCLEIHATQALIMHADLPLADSKAIDFFVAHHRLHTITLLPSHDFSGTNMLMLDLPLGIELAFGHDSYAKHQHEASTRQLAIRTVALPCLALDIDINSDLVTLQQLQAGTLC